MSDPTNKEERIASLQALFPERDIRKEIVKLVSQEASGNSFAVLLPAGTGFINTSYPKKGWPKWLFFRDTLEGEYAFLTFSDGTVAIKMVCGNSVRLLKSVPARKVRGTTSPPNPPTRESVKGPDKTNGAARQRLRDSHAVLTPTPGYTGGGSGSSGTAEQIIQQQQANAGSTDHTSDVGNAGGGAGTNYLGETGSTGGAADTAVTGGVLTPKTGDVGAPN